MKTVRLSELGVYSSEMARKQKQSQTLDPRSLTATGWLDIEPGRFQRGQLPNWCLSLTRKGRCDYELQDSTFELQPFDVLLIRPQTAQLWRADSEVGWSVTFAVFHPRPHWFEWLRLPEQSDAPGYHRHHLRDATLRRRVLRSMQRADRFAQSGMQHREALAMSAIEQALLYIQADLSQQTSSLDERVMRAAAYMDEHLADPLTLPQLAKACHVSRAHLAYLFEQQIGTPPMRYLEQQRIRRACQLLRLTTHPVSLIAEQVGFSDPKHFAKRFKKQVAKTPTGYREVGA